MGNIEKCSICKTSEGVKNVPLEYIDERMAGVRALLCPDCIDKTEDVFRVYDVIQERKAAERKERISRNIEQILMERGVGKIDVGNTFQSFRGSESDEVMRALRSGDSMLLQSECPGNGKTHLAVSCIREKMLQSGSMNALFIGAAELMIAIKETFNKFQNRESEAQFIRRMCNYDILVIDDVGTEMSSEYALSVMYAVVNRRHVDAKQTIYTTNMNARQLIDHYGKAMVSRMCAGKIIKFKGSDCRVKK